MALIHFRIDPVITEALLVGTIGAIAAIIGAGTAMKAYLQAGRSSTKQKGMLPAPLWQLTMIITAQGRAVDPLNLRLTFFDPALTLLRAELPNQLGKGAGAVFCVKEAQGVFVATVESKAAQRWYNSNPYWDGETKQLPIQVSIMSGGQAAFRTIWVAMCPLALPSSGLSDVDDFEWFLEGPVLASSPTLAKRPIERATIYTTHETYLKRRA